MIYISFKNLQIKNDVNIVKGIFCDVIGCSIGIYNFTPLEYYWNILYLQYHQLEKIINIRNQFYYKQVRMF